MHLTLQCPQNHSGFMRVGACYHTTTWLVFWIYKVTTKWEMNATISAKHSESANLRQAADLNFVEVIFHNKITSFGLPNLVKLS